MWIPSMTQLKKKGSNTGVTLPHIENKKITHLEIQTNVSLTFIFSK